MKNRLRFFFPLTCFSCKQKLNGEDRVCADCLAQLIRNHNTCFKCALPIEHNGICGSCLALPPPFDCTLAPFSYKPPLSNWILQLKFQHKLVNARILAEILGQEIKKYYDQKTMPELIIPIPLHPRRLQERGFNQAIEIAKPLAKKYHIPLSYEHIRRNKNTQAQSSLTASQRRINMAGAFTLSRDFAAEHVAILDDVMTTGQTVQIISHMLRKNGIKKIDIWCCARVE